MSTGNSTRETRTVILTDRVVVPGEFQTREWDEDDTLYPVFYPCGWKGFEQSVLVVANDPGHISVLTSVAATLLAQASVDERDWGYGVHEHRQKQAMRAEALRGQAMGELHDGLVHEYLDPLVASKLSGLLMQRKPLRVSISTDWEYASLVYGGMLLNKISDHKAEVLESVLGDVDMSNVLMRKYISRGNAYLNQCLGNGPGPGDNAPRENGKVLTEKYIEAALPSLMPSLRGKLAVNLTKRPNVTPCVTRVTPREKKSLHEKPQRSIAGNPFAALCT